MTGLFLDLIVGFGACSTAFMLTLLLDVIAEGAPVELQL